ncbi:hypothetical protein CM19_07710 [Candidatus Acidianus copahuensis]|uniref:Uncharacterized protein n=2 Tax=Sulfolobaceae TaxID=118883 RepID=A0A031LNX9_9CREN|nr:hypothetical protein CM19_07710 [Candidatus Acidianus copahuensis]NON62572.1 hypothetical protein [Acidianus sp. RZ1]
MECYVKEEDQELCVVICGKVICDEETVKSYGKLCEKCEKGDKKACVELLSRYGCWSSSGWWL